MNIDELTIGEAKKLAAMFGNQPVHKKHPLNGKKVIAVLPNGFIHIGTLEDDDGRYTLTEASNLRYWKERDGGLPELAIDGPKSGDRIDEVGNIYIETALFFYQAGNWS
jgi:hypothetical protein